MTYTTLEVTIRPNSTIEALIRHHNKYSVDRTELKSLVEIFNDLNPQAQPPRPGMVVLIPVVNGENNKNDHA